MRILQEGQGELFQPPDMQAFREWNRQQKSRRLVDKRMTEREAVQRFVHENSYVGTELYGSVRCPMSLAREVVRQRDRIRNLRVAGQGVLELDLWLAADLVRTLDITYIGLEVYGVSHALRRAVESGRTRTAEWSNAAITWRMKAAAMGVPFLPTTSMLGTDTLRHSAAKVVEDPFTGQPVCLLPALILDVGMIHVHRCDIYGNAQVEGISGFAFELARASKRLIVSAEEIVDTEEIRRYPDRTLIPYYLVDAVVHAPFGSYPGEMPYLYWRDEAEIRAWVEASQTAEGAAAYLQRTVFDLPDHAAFLEMVGRERLEAVQAQAPQR